MRLVKKFYKIVLIASTLFSLSGCYVMSLALHSNNQFNSRRLVDEVLGDPNESKKIKNKLRFVKRILEYAALEGLNSKGAYDYYIETSGKSVSYIVQAAKKDKLEFKTWWFPIVGSVPYRGYFDVEDRDRMADTLRKKDFDVFKTGASAFSSLGWLEDPIYGSMLKRNDASLSHLFFHELTHRTYWFPGKAKFNENLAEYVADVLTKNFLIGINRQSDLTKHLDGKNDKRAFKKWLSELKSELEKLFENKESKSKTEILKKKSDIFKIYIGDKQPKFKKYDYIGKGEWNNARVLAGSLYSPDIERFKKAHNCLGKVSVGTFLKNLENASDKIKNQFEALDSLCSPKLEL